MAPTRSPSLEQQVTSGDPEIGLRAVCALRRLAEELEPLHVARAREAGWSWERIARLLLVSRQAVHQKYAANERGEA
ncbi:MAG TPA: RNA polymerase subunit sigma-70 [Nonomuraea sp.]|nr:RNA polymerase subunit sigma-70 [Nonomuraea sp.]